MSLINTADHLYFSLGRNQGGLFLCSSQASTGHYSTFAEEYQSPISSEYGLDYVSLHLASQSKESWIRTTKCSPGSISSHPRLLPPNDSRSFVDPRIIPADLGLRHINPIDHFKLPGIARVDPYDPPKPSSPIMDPYGSAAGAYTINPDVSVTQPKASLATTTA
jgi:hypothetical protein